MKVSLVVASGVHQGKVIPIIGQQFLVGRDAQCQLRPASQAISKRHCGVILRDGKVYVRDFGSTNGTSVNDELIRDAEVAVEDGASLKIGPLDFTVRVERVPAPADGAPLPANTPESAAALAAVNAAAKAPTAPPRDTTPNPARPAKPGSKEAPALTGSKEAAAIKAGESAKPAAKPEQPAQFTGGPTDEENDRMAAMLLGMDDDGTAPVPDGSTVMDVPAANQGEAKTAEEKAKDDKKQGQTREGMSSAASEILRKMMRRPK